jgi:hypothetical protein
MDPPTERALTNKVAPDDTYDSNEHIMNPTLLDSWHKKDETHSANVPLSCDADFDGPVTHRKCTDVVWLVLFVLANLGLAAVLAYAFHEGDFERMLHGFDFRGELCGVDDLSGKEYVYWPEPNESLDLAICLPGCPANTAVQGICLYETDHETETDVCYNSYPSKPYVKMCIPASTDLREELTELIFQDVGFVTLRSAADIFRSWDIMLIGLAISFAFALLFLIFFRFPGTMVYVIIACSVLTVFLFGVISYLVWEES